MHTTAIKYQVPDIHGNPTGDESEDFIPTYKPEEAYQGCRPIFSTVDG